MGRDEVVAVARGLAPALRERARRTERDRRIPEATIKDLQAAGLFRVLQPARYGGYEADIGTYFDVAMALSAADASAGWVYSVLAVHSWLVSCMPAQAVDEIWGADPDTLVGASYLHLDGYIDKVADGYHVAGRFGFASGCHHTPWAVVAGVPRNQPDALVGLLVPSSDCQIDDNWYVMGLCGTGSCDLVVDAIVPPHRVVNHAGGSEVSDSSIYRLPFMTLFPFAVSVPLVGAAQGALDDYVTLQKDRVRMFGGNVAGEPATHARVAESAAELDAARGAASRNMAEIMALAAAGREYPPELLARLDRDRVLATRQAVTAIDRVFANAGGRALRLDNPVQRAWRDIHAGAAHAANHPDGILSAYGALAFGIQPATH